jgi:hypothetical protein
MVGRVRDAPLAVVERQGEHVRTECLPREELVELRPQLRARRRVDRLAREVVAPQLVGGEARARPHGLLRALRRQRAGDGSPRRAGEREHDPCEDREPEEQARWARRHL